MDLKKNEKKKVIKYCLFGLINTKTLSVRQTNIQTTWSQRQHRLRTSKNKKLTTKWTKWLDPNTNWCMYEMITTYPCI